MPQPFSKQRSSHWEQSHRKCRQDPRQCCPSSAPCLLLCCMSSTHLLMVFFQVSRGPRLVLCYRCACKTLKHSSQKHPRDCSGPFSFSFHLLPSSIQPFTSTYFSSGNTQNMEENSTQSPPPGTMTKDPSHRAILLRQRSSKMLIVESIYGIIDTHQGIRQRNRTNLLTAKQSLNLLLITVI